MLFQLSEPRPRHHLLISCGTPPTHQKPGCPTMGGEQRDGRPVDTSHQQQASLGHLLRVVAVPFLGIVPSGPSVTLVKICWLE